jgi:hypothetical protein
LQLLKKYLEHIPIFIVREFESLQLVDVSVDPVNIAGNLGENTRVRRQCAGMYGPGNNSNLLAVNKQGAAVVTL